MVGVLLFLLICIALPFALPTILTGLGLIAVVFYAAASRAGFAVGWLWGLLESMFRALIYWVMLGALVGLFVGFFLALFQSFS
uniref:Uncharacterized protein n=1 Tax=uncultured prokaryote TaxID=198431 RepID=A0A0H5PZE2_9ZZZZ|nr:hypothetical protein [uncultured prokaryote]